MKERYDVIVVGAGPAGSTAARMIADAGFSVLICEKDRDVGMPVRCGEAVSNRSIEQLVDLDPRWIAATINRFKLIAPNGLCVEPDLGGFGYVLERRIFDYDLARLAADAGAEVRTKAYVDGLHFSNGTCDGVTMLVQGEPNIVFGKIIIGADGVESRVGKWAGIDTTTPFRDMECCAQMTLTNITTDDDACEFYFGNAVAPQGYLWIFPKGNHMANVGLGLSGEAAKKKSPLRYLREFVERKYPNSGILTTVAGGVPCAPTLSRIVRENVVLVGDAAHQVNPMSGGGITSGMFGGTLAASAIIKALHANNFSLLEAYEREWDKRFGSKHRTYYKMKNAIFKISDDALNGIAEKILAAPASNRDLWSIFKIALFQQPALVWEMVKVFGL